MFFFLFAQRPWGAKLLMNIANVITDYCEVTQLGLHLDVDENEIKRMISGKYNVAWMKMKIYLIGII